MNQKKTILDFLRRHSLAVISTTNNNNPQSAVVEFAETDDLKIIFDCFHSSRKYRNIQENPHVSFVVGWDDNITIQYEGIATEISGTELEIYKHTFYKKLPDAMKFEKYSEIRFLKVTPTWIRYSDLNQKPWEVYEVQF